jgi:hypothetical protein
MQSFSGWNEVLLQWLRLLLLDESPDIDIAAHAQSMVASAAGWDDPEMDVYEDYDVHRAKL